MRAPLLSLLLPLALAGCLKDPVTSAEGYRCALDGDCDEQTWCIAKRCVMRVDAATRPGPQNTGAPHDVALTPSGPLSLSTAGQVLENLEVAGCVQIRAERVTLRRSRIRCSQGFWAVQISAAGAVLEDVEIDGTGSDSLAAIGGPVTLRRADVHHVYRGAVLGSGSTVEASWFHDLTGATAQGVVADATHDVTVRKSSIELGATQHGSAVDVSTNTTRLEDVLIEANWVQGGDFTVRAGADDGARIQVNDNRFGRGYLQGPLWVGPNTLHARNVFDDDNSEVPLQ
ncbi:MAG: hypothetical protein IPJ65_10645 [Archangiaceae bacterium]|nr:hypothetical protein [Archangiaceae bacterium]